VPSRQASSQVPAAVRYLKFLHSVMTDGLRQDIAFVGQAAQFLPVMAVPFL